MRRRFGVTAVTIVVCLVAAACGSTDTPDPQTGKSQAPSQERTRGSVDHQKRISAAISRYLSLIIDEPDKVHSATAAVAADDELARAAQGASARCLDVVRRTRQAILQVQPGAAAKRKLVLDASVHVLDRC